MTKLDKTYKDLFREIRILIDATRRQVAKTINRSLVILYWTIGDRICREILKEKRAEYGEKIVSTLSKQLNAIYGRGYSRANLFRMIRFVEVFPDQNIVSTLSRQLGWSH